MNVTRNTSLLLFIGISTFLAQPIQATASQTQVSRYFTVENDATAEQKDLLVQTRHVRFPANVQSIEDAIHYFLKETGYKFDNHDVSDAVACMLSQSLPIILRELGPVTIKNGLTALAGPAFILEHDPVSRTIYFTQQEVNV